MKERFCSERQALCRALKGLGASGLSPGSTGNASIRVDGGMLISPTGLVCSETSEEQLVFIDEDGNCPAGQLKPSSEWHMHHAIYSAFPQTSSIVHCHSRYATTLACLRKPIPPYHYMVATVGGDDIPCADYATFGTKALADRVVTALINRRGCLMANHGQIACAATPDDALALAIQIEDLAAGYYQTLALGGPQLLNSHQMAEVMEKFSGYGQQ